MRTEQRKWTEHDGWLPGLTSKIGTAAQLVLIFGSRKLFKGGKFLSDVRKIYPQAYLLGCSTAGEILKTEVSDNTIVTTAIQFEHSLVKTIKVNLDAVGGNSFEAGAFLGKSLDKDGLVHVLTISDGIRINGSDLVRGLMAYLPKEVNITGGLAGDGSNFEETLVLHNESAPEKGIVTVLGLYGHRLKVGYGSFGGWDPFGPERLVTRSSSNVLYELDGRSALELYKEYLADQASGLPATALFFPLNVRNGQNGTPLVRTILSIDEKEQSMTFAGDIPIRSYARLMKANTNRLIDGAASAANMSLETIGNASPDLAILISCVGRKLVLRQRVEEEIEAVSHVLGKNTALTGFYSYGELCPSLKGGVCELHNQTMTITTLLEK